MEKQTCSTEVVGERSLHISILNGEITIGNGKLDDAKQILDSIDDRDNIFFVSAYAQYLWEVGEKMEAVKLWEKVKNENALLIASQSSVNEGELEISGQSYRALYRLNDQKNLLLYADFLFNIYGEQDKASELILAMINKYPNSVYRRQWYRRLGKIADQTGEIEKSEIYYSILTSEFPTDAVAWVELGWIKFEQTKDINSVQEYFENAIRYSPESGEGFSAMGQLKVLEGSREEADFWFKKAIILNPEAKWWYLERAENASANENHELAREIFEEILLIFPDFIQAQYRYSVFLYKTKEYSAASFLIENVLISLDNPNQWHFIQAGDIFLATDRFDKALDAYQQALSIDPANLGVKTKIEALQEK